MTPMDPERIKAVLTELGEPSFRLSQVLEAAHRGTLDYARMKALPAALRTILRERAPLSSVSERGILVSRDGRARKARLVLGDGTTVESVLLRPKPDGDWTACLSCQVGCAMGCAFCATGLMGLSRSLRAEEISDQVLFWKAHMAEEGLPGRLSNAVYMGMGEPFNCYDAVAGSLRTLMDPKGFALAARHLSVSTVGLAPAMERFAEEFPQVNLALSLHAADDLLRERLIPLARAHPLKELARTLRRILETKGRKIFLEYALLAGVNDGPAHALGLARWVRSVGRPDLLLVNLIAWNPVAATPFTPATVDGVREFRDLLRGHGLSVTVRSSLGSDIRGACGQLATAPGRSGGKK